MKTKIVPSLVILFVAVLAATFWSVQHVSAPTLPAPPTPLPPNDHKNISYVIDGEAFTLVNGYAESSVAPGSEAKTITRYFGNEAKGDLNADGAPDIAFLLTRDNGGSGTFYYAAVALVTPEGYAGTNTILLGDRIAPQTTEIRDGLITVNYADRNPGEPMTASPSMGVSKYFRVKNGELVSTYVPVENSKE